MAEKQKTGELSRVKGTVKGEGVNIADLKKTFNDSQNRAYRLLTRYAETTGVNIVLYNSQADESTGDYPAAQGRFQWKDDTIYVDINSGLNNVRDVNDLGRYTMLRTFAHEFTHFLEKWNAQGYNEFREFVFRTLEEKGENVHDLIEEKQALDESGKMTYEQASREVVADAMMDILPDSSPDDGRALLHFFVEVADPEKEAREKKSLYSIDDSFQKIVITRNGLHPQTDEKGIQTVDLFDFLLNHDICPPVAL